MYVDEFPDHTDSEEEDETNTVELQTPKKETKERAEQKTSSPKETEHKENEIEGSETDTLAVSSVFYRDEPTQAEPWILPQSVTDKFMNPKVTPVKEPETPKPMEEVKEETMTEKQTPGKVSSDAAIKP